MIMNINKIRKKLGSILKNILFNNTFQEKYYLVSDNLDDDKIADVLLQYAESTDEFVYLLAENLHSQTMLEKILNDTDALIIFTFFLRYNYLTQRLAAENQICNFPYNLSSNNSAFLSDLLTKYWSSPIST